MAISNAQAAASARYVKKTYDKILLQLRRDGRGDDGSYMPTRDDVATHAASQGLAMAEYIKRLIRDDMARHKTPDA
jgi:hypothetical protein